MTQATFTVKHIDTCLPCYLTDHHNREGECLIGVMVPNHRLAFRGFADMVREPGCVTPAALYTITDEDEAQLDCFEGVRTGAYRKTFLRLPTQRHGTIRALVCLRGADRPEAPPAAEYVARLRLGYRDWRLPMEALDSALREAGYFRRPDPPRVTYANLRARQRDLLMPEPRK